MGLQKYRADEKGVMQRNGGIPFYTKWMGGPTLALIRSCPIENRDISARTVYTRGEPDTFFSIPAACRYKGKTVEGYVCTDKNGEYTFRALHSDRRFDVAFAVACFEEKRVGVYAQSGADAYIIAKELLAITHYLHATVHEKSRDGAQALLVGSYR